MTEKIARRGLHIYREYGVDPLERQHVADVMTREVIAIDADLPMREVVTRYFGASPRHRGYPVVGKDGVLGMLHQRDAVEADGLSRCSDVLMPLTGGQVLLPEATTRFAAGRMAELGMNRLPVVADRESMRLVGVVSLSDLLRPSKRVLAEETVRERLR